MKRYILIFVAAVAIPVIVGCATVGGTLVGAGLGSMYGDAELGADVGMTAGLVVDLFGR